MNYHKSQLDSYTILLGREKTRQNFGHDIFFSGSRLFNEFQITSYINTFKCHVFCTDGKISVRINLPLFSTVVPSIICMFLSGRPFVVITTLSTGLVGVEVTSVSWLGELTVGV